MGRNPRHALVGFVFALVCSALASPSIAQITGVVNSDVEAFFGSQSDAFQSSEPPIGPTWASNVAGPYGVAGPNVPALYPGYPSPNLALTPNIPYDTGHIGPGFSDPQLTTSNYSIVGNFSGGTFTGDAYAQTFGPPMTLNQPASATGFAYEKAEFAMTFSVGPSGIAAGLAPAYPFIVTGNVLPGSGAYAQFGAQVDYWWVPVIPGTIIPSGPAVNLGTLTYNYLQTGGGPFGSLVNHSATTLAGATGVGFLQITGEMFVSGDPFSISVMSVPEPSTFALAAVALTGLGVWGYRRRR